jgi:hypothetical protein
MGSPPGPPSLSPAQCNGEVSGREDHLKPLPVCWGPAPVNQSQLVCLALAGRESSALSSIRQPAK